MAKANYIYVTHWHNAPKGHSSYQKYHLKKMAPNIDGISQKWQSYSIGFLTQ